jgi:hypothetical protein
MHCKVQLAFAAAVLTMLAWSERDQCVRHTPGGSRGSGRNGPESYRGSLIEDNPSDVRVTREAFKDGEVQTLVLRNIPVAILTTSVCPRRISRGVINTMRTATSLGLRTSKGS